MIFFGWMDGLEIHWMNGWINRWINRWWMDGVNDTFIHSFDLSIIIYSSSSLFYLDHIYRCACLGSS